MTEKELPYELTVTIPDQYFSKFFRAADA